MGSCISSGGTAHSTAIPAMEWQPEPGRSRPGPGRSSQREATFSVSHREPADKMQ